MGPQGSYLRFGCFSAGPGLPNLRERHTYADCHRDADGNDHSNVYTDRNAHSMSGMFTDSSSPHTGTPPLVVRTAKPSRYTAVYSIPASVVR